jgi:FkbH-like protein
MIKCVIWDLDNTIWEGILSENQNIVIREKMVDLVKLFYERGVVNSICSKNELNSTREKLIELGMWKYFIFPQINWKDKSENFKKIISNLHFREHNVLFIDDNQFEIDEVRNVFPNINVCNAYDTEKLNELKNSIIDVESSLALDRIEMYRLEEKRLYDEERMLLSKEEFLATCDIRINIRDAVIDEIERLSELIDRTNQINSTGIRYSEDEITEMIKNYDEYDVYIAEICDIYGSYGKSGLVIAKKCTNDYEVMLLIVSCRLIGKGVSQALMNHIWFVAKQKGYKKLKCLFKKNKFNRQMILLYTMNGFRKKKNEDLVNSVDEYYLNIIGNKIEKPSWISMSYN